MDDDMNKGTRYWGDIDEIMKELFNSPTIEHADDEVAAASENIPTDSRPSTPSGLRPESPLNSGTLDVSRASPALGQEINALRYRYLNGKLAGQDLADQTGTIIIRKNEPITPEIVDSADRAGKLAELIVNMTIPELVE